MAIRRPVLRLCPGELRTVTRRAAARKWEASSEDGMPPQGSAGGRGLVALSIVLEPVTADPQEVVLEISWRHPVTVVGDRDHVVSVRDVDADRSGLRTFQSEARMG